MTTFDKMAINKYSIVKKTLNVLSATADHNDPSSLSDNIDVFVQVNVRQVLDDDVDG